MELELNARETGFNDRRTFIAEANKSEPSTTTISVFVHLATNKDAEEWAQRQRSGVLVGVNDETPYGYGRAEKIGCKIIFSKFEKEGLLKKFGRLTLRVLLGFDFVHAWRQRAGFAESDVIWTHTESQYLSVAAVVALTRSPVKIIGQTIWLIDNWRNLWFPHRILYRALIEKVDVLTFHSPDNASVARKLFPRADVRLVQFGIPSESRTEPRARNTRPIRVLALGNDRHRDWPTLIKAVSACTEMSLLILSGSVSPRLARGTPNVRIQEARTNDELKQAFDDATIVCVPLRSNLHASGLTVIQEAVLAGVPVVATDTGGLRAYFSDNEVRYVAPGDPDALRAALLEVAHETDLSAGRARRAQARMFGKEAIGCDSYIREHVEISREILGS